MSSSNDFKMSFVPYYVGESRLCFTAPYKDHLFKHESGPYKDGGLYTEHVTDP